MKTVNTCTIITTEPNELIKPIHDRMPVIVSKEYESTWLDPENINPSELLSILKSYPAEDMKMEEIKIGRW